MLERRTKARGRHQFEIRGVKEAREERVRKIREIEERNFMNNARPGRMSARKVAFLLLLARFGILNGSRERPGLYVHHILLFDERPRGHGGRNTALIRGQIRRG